MRSDVFGLGAILCEILTGKPPYVAASIQEVCNHARKGYLDEAGSRLEKCGAGPELLALVKSCLAYEPRDRPGDASKVARELRRYLDALEERARRSAVETAAARVKAGEDRRARRLMAVLGVAALLLLGVAGGVYVGVEGRRRAEAETADRAVQDDLRGAGELLGRARARGIADLPLWESALVAGRSAKERAEQAVVPPERQAEARRFLEEVEGEARRAREEAERREKDRRMVERLEGLRSTGAASADELARDIIGHRQAFLDHGIDAEGPPEPVLDVIRSSGVGADLARGLGAWALLERSLYGQQSQGWRSLLRLGLAVAPDSTSEGLLRAVESDDTHGLRRVAAGLDLGATSMPTLTLLASALQRKSSPVATALFVVLSERKPESYLAHIALSRIHRSASEKRAHAVAALALEPGPAAYANLGDQLDLGEPATVRGVLEAGLRRWPDAIQSGSMLAFLGSAYSSLKDLGRSVRYYEAAIAKNPRGKFVHNNFGVALANAGNLERSLAEFEESLRLEREPIAQGNVGITLQELGRDDAALPALEEAIRLGPSDDFEAVYNSFIGRIFINRRDPERACYHYREAIRLSPDQAAFYNGLGWALDVQGKVPEAIEAFRRALELEQISSDALLTNMIASLRNIGPPDPALMKALGSFAAEVERILASGTGHRADLKEIYLAVVAKRLEGLPPPEALAVARAEVAKPGGSDADGLGLLARAQFLAGERRDAILTLERASDLDGFQAGLKDLLSRYRAAVLPDLPTMASIDAALTAEAVLVDGGDSWRYFPGERDPSPGLEWTRPEFDDGGWKEGPGGFGYSDNDDRTVLEDMQNHYTAVYVRRRVLIPSPDEFTRFVLRVRSDDGFVAYLNGEEVGRVRAGIPGERLAATAVAYEDHEATAADVIEVPPRLARPGENLLAVQGLNKSLTSSDFTLIVELLGVRTGGLEKDRERFAAFRQAEVSEGAAARVPYLEGRLLQRAARIEEAILEFEKACAAAPSEPLPLLGLTECLRAAGRSEESAARLRERIGSLARTGRPLLESWLAEELRAGRKWAEILAVWPRGAPPYDRVILPTSEKDGETWQFTTTKPAGGWEKPAFDPSTWKTGAAPFGRRETGDPPRTPWSTADIWLRRAFDWSEERTADQRLEFRLKLRIFHDDEAEVYLNGVEVARLASFSSNQYVVVPLDLSRSLQRGENVLAIHCHQRDGVQMIDAGLIETIIPR
jgi:tetratricopeptide (TPR) repeat protein